MLAAVDHQVVIYQCSAVASEEIAVFPLIHKPICGTGA
jgi:hypothetical protein